MNNIPGSVMKVFKHYKGARYLVMGEGVHTETEERLVFYCSLKGKFYARPSKIFHSNVLVDGVTKKRFEEDKWFDSVLN